MSLAYFTVDVFSDAPFSGNQLAVITDARGLNDHTMQSIAAEFAYSETTFLCPPIDPKNTASLRIFTPKAELSFAGHPNIGTAFVISRLGELFGRSICSSVVFEEKCGLVSVEIIKEYNVAVGARLTSPKIFKMGDQIDLKVTAAACSIDPSQLVSDPHAPCIASCGLPWILARVASSDVLAKAKPNREAFMACVSGIDALGIELYAVSNKGDLGADTFKARVFAPHLGIDEDAATGSANMALAGMLAHIDARKNAKFIINISQGTDIGRPSLLHAEADKINGLVKKTRISGRCTLMMEGRLLL